MPAQSLAPLPRPDLDHVLVHTESFWREMAGASVFSAGGTGFFGVWILESLAWANARLRLGMRATVLSRDPASFSRRMPYLAANDSIEFLAGDVRNFKCAETRFTHLVHAAFDSGRAIASPYSAFDTLATGTHQVLEFAARQPLQRMLFVSSGAVYGPQPANLPHVAESCRNAPDPLSPASAYAEGKRVGEFLCGIAAANGLPVSIARCFSFIGPGLAMDSHFAAGNFLRDAHRGQEIMVKGDGTPLRSYLYAADLVIWLWTILLHGKPGRAYNVGSDEAISIGELAQLISSCSNSPQGVSILGKPAVGNPERYVPDVSRARTELSLDITIPLPQAIQRTLSWMKSHSL